MPERLFQKRTDLIERDRKIVELRDAGVKNPEIARQFGISIPRVSQIYGRMKRQAQSSETT